jgi:energy-coupling factor transporter transmembrane protein EcfT
MSSTANVLTTNPGLLIVSALMIVSLLVLGVAALGMRRAGRSLRPIVFLGGFMAIVIAPQLIFHTAQAFGWIPKNDLTWTGTPAATTGSVTYRVDTARLTHHDGRFLDRAGLFGPLHDSSLVTDLRTRMPGGPFAQAAAAEMAILPPASSITVAAFETLAQSETAAVAYLSQAAGRQPSRGADGAYTIRRATDMLKVVVADRALIAWSGPDSAAVATALATSPLVKRESPASAAARSVDATEDFWLYRPLTLIALVLGLVAIAVFWFFRMAAWAGEVSPDGSVTPVSGSALRQRLLEVNALDVPFTVAADAHDPTRLVATWRYADAKWIDFARAHGMTRTHRITLRLDDNASIVRYFDQSATMEWSAGFDAASLQWSTERGIVFFQQDWQRVLGVQVDNTGRLTKQLSYTWRFNLQEMKAPLVQVTTNAGWRWRPTLLDGPRWLRWLTH